MDKIKNKPAKKKEKKHISRVRLILYTILALFLIGGYVYLFMGSRVTDADDKVKKGSEDTTALIVYFSRSGVITEEGDVDAISAASMTVYDGATDRAAEQLQKITGADMYQIKTKRHYRNSYGGTAMAALIEERLKTSPSLAAKPDNIDKYDVIYVGFPVWWFNAPMAVGSFLKSYDLTGKKIVPFCTSEDNGIDVCMDYIRKVSGDAEVLDGYRFSSPTDDDIRTWLAGIGINISQVEQ